MSLHTLVECSDHPPIKKDALGWTIILPVRRTYASLLASGLRVFFHRGKRGVRFVNRPKPIFARVQTDADDRELRIFRGKNTLKPPRRMPKNIYISK